MATHAKYLLRGLLRRRRRNHQQKIIIVVALTILNNNGKIFLRDDYWFFSTSDQLAFGMVETQPAQKATQKSSRIEIYKSQCKQQWEKAATHRKTKGPGRTPRRGRNSKV